MTTYQETLLAWINDHDCGVSPTAIFHEDSGEFEIRVEAVTSTGERSIEVERVKTFSEARIALGY